ncbi:head maturation protease, ClpP-related [Terrihabitans rhizophilus]|uniref:ATP-dependent Clp protease proteolytic subunit n=1 Tax=Terrihabitans rhizophilus TaxID=3092662 RepID=A0ABU4RNA5_9HYPH|nr:head maturation protease, ClpP-related [Terrihabitans sp. PJ23]MDX6806322.1 Clp protease ClpP [Terrihabitans sp. PJ23]
MAAILNGGELTPSGDVGDAWFDDHFTYSDVVIALAQIDDTSELTVRLNSPGGIATEGAAIHALLSRREGATNVVVDGVAMSSASLIAMAGDTITMTLGSTMMIHDPENISVGNSDAHAKSIEHLETLATSFARIYAGKSGKSPEECRSLMKAETWFTPEEAVAAGFADAPGDTKARAAAPHDYRAYAHAPKRLRALAAKKNWHRKDADMAAPSAADPRQAEENSMSEANQGGPNTADIERARREAVMAYQTRRKTVMAFVEVKGREALAENLIDTDLTEDGIKAALAAAPKADAATARADDVSELEARRLNGEGLNAPGKPTPATAKGTTSMVANMRKLLGQKETA